MAKNNQRGRNNNNPQGHNQYSNGWMDTAKDYPLATAAAVAGAVGAGVFLWSKRNQVSNQVGKISQTANEMSRKAGNKATDWLDKMHSDGSQGSNREVMLTEGPNESAAIEASRATSSRSRKSGANMNAGRSSSTTVSY